MPQSLSKVYVHIVFSTKNREPFITEEIKEELFAYIGGICKQMECTPIRVGGHADHVHILCSLSKKVTIIKLLEEVKKRSSKWVKTKGQTYSNFYWQDGYAIFSVNPDGVSTVKKYIEQQVKHHRKKTFQMECREFFKEFRVKYDEKYVWD